MAAAAAAAAAAGWPKSNGVGITVVVAGISVTLEVIGGPLIAGGEPSAFAAVKGDGSVVTWGCGGRWGDSTAVQEQLTGGVEEIYSTINAFAAVKGDGSVVT